LLRRPVLLQCEILTPGIARHSAGLLDERRGVNQRQRRIRLARRLLWLAAQLRERKPEDQHPHGKRFQWPNQHGEPPLFLISARSYRFLRGGLTYHHIAS